MKNVSLIVWITQLGISVAVPLGGFVLLGVWLRQRFDWGIWAIIAGVILGMVCAINGLRNSLRMMEQMATDKKEPPPPISFNDHE